MARRLLLGGILVTILLVPVGFIALVVPQALPVSVVKRYPSWLRSEIVVSTANDAQRSWPRDPEQAKRLLQFALAVEPDNPRALSAACQIYDTPIALPYCRRLTEVQPNEKYASDLLAGSLYQTGNLKEAAAIHLRQLQLHPCFFDEYSDYRDTLRKQGNGEESIPILQTALRLRDECDPQHKDENFAVYILEPLVRELLAARRYDEAVEAARLLVAEPVTSPVQGIGQIRRVMLAMALEGKGDQPSADKEYELAKAKGPCKLVEGKDHSMSFRCTLYR